MKYVLSVSSIFFISFLIGCSDGRIQENQDQIAQNQSASSELKQAGESNQPMAEWHEKLLTSLQANHVPLSRSVLIHDKGIKKIEIFLINGALSSQVPLDAESIRKTVWEATHDSTHPNYGRKSAFAYYSLPETTYPKIIELINSIHATPFDNLVKDLEDKYQNRRYRDYRLLIEIQYHNQEKVEILTTDVLYGNFLLAKIVQNRRSHYVVMDNKDMDILMKYVDPEIITWKWARPYI